MESPNPQIVKIVRYYDNGSVEVLDGLYLQNYLENLHNDEVINYVHDSNDYKEVVWRKIKGHIGIA